MNTYIKAKYKNDPFMYEKNKLNSFIIIEIVIKTTWRCHV